MCSGKSTHTQKNVFQIHVRCECAESHCDQQRAEYRFHMLFWVHVRTCPEHPSAWNVVLKPPLFPEESNVN